MILSIINVFSRISRLHALYDIHHSPFTIHCKSYLNVYFILLSNFHLL